MKNTLVAMAFGLAFLSGPLAASAATISFADLAVPGTGFMGFGSTVLHDGFTFTSNLPIGGPGLSVWKTDDTSHPAGGAATTSLFDFTAGNTTTIARTDGGVFGLNAIDLGNYGVSLGGFPATFAVTFVGTRADHSTVQQTFMVANFPGQPQLQTFSFTGFSNLVSVSMQQGTYSAGAAFQFDNLVVVTGPSVLCDTEVSHSAYVNGDLVQVPTLRFANLTTGPAAVEIKVWLGVPGATASILNAGATGSVVLPAGVDANLGPFTFFTVTPGMPRGGYEFSCRLLDPTTGEIVSVKRTSFVIH